MKSMSRKRYSSWPTKVSQHWGETVELYIIQWSMCLSNDIWCKCDPSLSLSLSIATLQCLEIVVVLVVVVGEGGMECYHRSSRRQPGVSLPHRFSISRYPSKPMVAQHSQDTHLQQQIPTGEGLVNCATVFRNTVAGSAAVGNHRVHNDWWLSR